MVLQNPSRDDEEPPLDPAAERLRKKLARLLLGSLGIMALGLIAVFAAIVYRIGGYDADPQSVAQEPLSGTEAVEAQIALPAGTRLLSMSLEGGRALLHVEGAGGTASLLLVDLASGAIIGHYLLEAE